MKKVFVMLCAAVVCAASAFAQSANESTNVNCAGSVQITATPATGYHFVQWQDGNTENPRTISNIKEAKNFIATFAANEVNFGDGVGIDIPNPNVGDNITLTATPTDDCLEFDKWSDGVKTNPRSITYTGTVPFTAVYKTKVFNVNVTTSTGDATRGTVTVTAL